MIAEGAISSFGSIYVNGVEYDINDSNVIINDIASSASELSLGMIVMVNGKLDASGDHGVAESVYYSARIEGPVDDINLAEKYFIVFGQVIRVTELTVFDGIAFDALAVGNVVEVSAYFDDLGDLVATRVAFKDDDVIPGEHEFKLKGIIASHDPDTQTFDIGNIRVQYAGAELENLPEGGLIDGLFVRVKSYQGIVDGMLMADWVSVRLDEGDDDVGHQRAVDGVIVEVIEGNEVGNREIVVNDWYVLISADTRLQHGNLNDIEVGARVKVHGRVNDHGKLVARKIRFDKPGSFQIEGEVEAIDLETQTLRLLGLLIQVDGHTHFQDRIEHRGNKDFALSDLMPGDFIEARLMENRDAQVPLIAKKIVRLRNDFDEDGDQGVRVSGLVTEIEKPRFYISHLPVVTSEDTEFEGPENQLLSLDLFFDILVVDARVEVEGRINDDGEFDADQVEIKSLEQDDHPIDVNIKGEINHFVSVTEFSVNQHAIITTDDTRYEVSGAEDLAEGILVEIDGWLNESGIIVARKIALNIE